MKQNEKREFRVLASVSSTANGLPRKTQHLQYTVVKIS